VVAPKNHYSPHAEDQFLWYLFQQLGFRTFTYLDLGAHHPSFISVTKLFYDNGCRGINVEPNRYLYEQFLKERPEDTNVCCGVGVKEGHANFYSFQELKPCTTRQHKPKLRLQIENGDFGKSRLESVFVVYVNRLVKLHCKGHWPEFLNCSIGGAEFEVLESAHFGKYPPIVLCVKVSIEDAKGMSAMLWEKHFCAYVRIGPKVIYVRNDYWEKLTKALGIW